MKLWSTLFDISLLASTVRGVFAVLEQETDKKSSLFLDALVNQGFLDYKNPRCFS
jgi:hypothetical protein